MMSCPSARLAKQDVESGALAAATPGVKALLLCVELAGQGRSKRTTTLALRAVDGTERGPGVPGGLLRWVFVVGWTARPCTVPWQVMDQLRDMRQVARLDAVQDYVESAEGVPFPPPPPLPEAPAFDDSLYDWLPESDAESDNVIVL
jgi:hypothetical protein